MNFNIELEKRLSEIEEILKDYLPKEEGYYKKLMEAMNYSILAGGKRIRPMLMLETFRLFEGRDINILHPFMAAIEMIHTYSLVHDDLPAMDNDEYRRGRKTTHIVYGEAMAILAGDGLLTLAFETAAKAFNMVDDTLEEAHIIYKRIIRALQIMYLLKTGALIEASMMIGGVIAGAGDDEIRTIESIASDIGLAFQIRDDILDVTGDDKILGKPVHSDEKNDKSTYIAIMDIEQAIKEVSSVTDRARKAYESLPYKNEYLESLIIKLMNRDK
jgi:geranylgeranyl diphosphate synthase type II